MRSDVTLIGKRETFWLSAYTVKKKSYRCNLIVTGEQLRAPRAIARLEQADLASKAGVSVDTVKRLERTVGPISANVATMAGVVAALEAAGVIFVAENGDGPGVRLKKQQASVEVLNQQIAEAHERISREGPSGPASPEKGMRQLRTAKAKNELVKLKNRRTKLKGKE